MLRGAEKQLGVSLKCNKSCPLLSDCKPKAKNTLTQEEVASVICTVSPLGAMHSYIGLETKNGTCLLLEPAVGKEFDSRTEEFSRD